MTSAAPVRHRCRCHRTMRARGVMLVVCLMFLLIISLTAAVTVRRATSSDAVAGSGRTQALAFQAAEAALLYCESFVTQPATAGPAGSAPAAAPAAMHEPFDWQTLAHWDGPDSHARVRTVPFAGSDSEGGRPYYQRSPECMAQYQLAGSTATAVVTARGFGPEVAPADGGRSAPRGTEIWLQSVVSTPAPGKPASRSWRQIFLRTR